MKQATPYRFSFSTSVLGLLMAGASFAFPTVPVGLLCFYFAACWILWTVCSIKANENRMLLLVGMWVAIDVAVLVMFLSMTATVGDVRDSPGTELVWFICYAPMMLPGVLVSAPFTGDVDTAAKSLPPLFNPAVDRVIADWVQFSFVAAIQAFVVTLLVPSMQALRRVKAN